MKHTQEDLNTFEKLQNEEINLKNIFNTEHDKCVDFITKQFKNISEETKLDINLRSLNSYDQDFSITIHFSNQIYYWSSNFFSLDFSYSKKQGLEFKTRCSTGGIHKDVDDIEALNLKADIYKSTVNFANSLRNDLEVFNALKNKMDHYEKVYNEWSNKKSKLHTFKRFLENKENEFKTNNLLKVLMKPFNINKRVEEITEQLFDQNRIACQINIVALDIEDSFKCFKFKEFFIKMENSKRLSLKINNKRASKKEVIELLKKEFFITRSFSNKLQDISFIDPDKIKYNHEDKTRYVSYELSEIEKVFEKSLNIFNF